MAKTPQTPASALIAFMEEYQLNPFSLSKKIGLSTSAVRQIAIGKSGITVPAALRLAKFFGNTPSFWLDIQLQAEMQAAADDKQLQALLKGITKAVKPSAPKEKAKPAAPKKAAEKKAAAPRKKAAAGAKKPAGRKPASKK